MSIIHMCVSVAGLLKLSNAELQRVAQHMTIDGKKLQTADEVKNALLDELAQGHEVLPICECDNFDYKKGCLGHKSDGDREASTNDAL